MKTIHDPMNFNFFGLCRYLCLCACFLCYSNMDSPEWGFYGHRLINRMSVFTLPTELIPFYKQNIEFMTEHAVDPDKRRYASRHEGVRHYIDIDHWGVYPFPEVPRDFEEAIMTYAEIYLLDGTDTFYIQKSVTPDSVVLNIPLSGGIRLSAHKEKVLSYWKKVVKPMYYEEEWRLSGYDLDDLFHTEHFRKKHVGVVIVDRFSEFGIIPYFLEDMQAKLTRAFESGQTQKILRLSAEFGHYIGDAHVPLHTTANYNGQLTNQLGIHAFWESRIPELLAENEWDFFVGKAEYIENKRAFFWDIVMDSHLLLDSVLNTERRLSTTFARDRQFCYDDRLGRTVRIQCPEYASAYSREMNNMVELRMREAIHAVGSCIYTAWVDSGQPPMGSSGKMVMASDTLIPDRNIVPRPHEEIEWQGF